MSTRLSLLLIRFPQNRTAPRLYVTIGTASIVVVLATFAFVGTARATAKKWYWTEAHAEAAVHAKVRLPFCRVYTEPDPDCANGKTLPGRHPIGFVIGDVSCTGSNEKGQSFTYARFRCRATAKYSPRFGATVAVYPTGSTTFRWKVL